MVYCADASGRCGSWESSGPGAVADHPVEVDPGVLDDGGPRSGPFTVAVAPAPDVVLRCTLILDPAGTGVTSWSGQDDAQPPRSVTVVLTAGTLAVRIAGTDRSWEIVSAGDGRYRSDEIDRAAFSED